MMENREISPKPTGVFERHPIITMAVFLIAVIVIIDFIAGRLLIPKKHNSFRTSHYYYHHGLLKNKDELALWGSILYPFHTNSLGFRDTARNNIATAKQKKRVLLMGDSHTEAVGVRVEKSFFGLLQDSLQKLDIEVLNTAAISYSPKIHFLKAKYLLENKKLEVDKIIVFIDISDLQNELVYKDFNPLTINVWREAKTYVVSFFRRNSFVFYSVNTLRENKQKEEFFQKAILFDNYRKSRVRTNTEDLYAGFFTNFDDKILLSNPQFHGVGEWYYNEDFKKLAEKGIELGQENIHKLDSICKIRGIDLTIAVHPWHPQVMKGDTTDLYVESWREFAQKEQIGFINLFPVFINEENPIEVIQKYYLKDDNHWNENGHRKVASAVLPGILQSFKK